jgi:hypothetical protein
MKLATAAGNKSRSDITTPVGGKYEGRGRPHRRAFITDAAGIAFGVWGFFPTAALVGGGSLFGRSEVPICFPDRVTYRKASTL